MKKNVLKLKSIHKNVDSSIWLSLYYSLRSRIWSRLGRSLWFNISSSPWSNIRSSLGQSIKSSIKEKSGQP